MSSNFNVNARPRPYSLRTDVSTQKASRRGKHRRGKPLLGNSNLESQVKKSGHRHLRQNAMTVQDSSRLSESLRDITTPDTSSDHAIATILQREYDAEHNQIVNDRNIAFDGAAGNSHQEKIATQQRLLARFKVEKHLTDSGIELSASDKNMITNVLARFDIAPEATIDVAEAVYDRVLELNQLRQEEGIATQAGSNEGAQQPFNSEGNPEPVVNNNEVTEGTFDDWPELDSLEPLVSADSQSSQSITTETPTGPSIAEAIESNELEELSELRDRRKAVQEQVSSMIFRPGDQEPGGKADQIKMLLVNSQKAIDEKQLDNAGEYLLSAERIIDGNPFV